VRATRFAETTEDWWIGTYGRRRRFLIYSHMAVRNLVTCKSQAKNGDRPQLVPFREHNMNSSGMQHAARRSGTAKSNTSTKFGNGQPGLVTDLLLRRRSSEPKPGTKAVTRAYGSREGLRFSKMNSTCRLVYTPKRHKRLTKLQENG